MFIKSNCESSQKYSTFKKSFLFIILLKRSTHLLPNFLFKFCKVLRFFKRLIASFLFKLFNSCIIIIIFL